MAERIWSADWPSSTRRAISVRIDRAAAESESATDWLRQVGHLRLEAIVRTRSSVVRGGPSSTPLRTSATRTRAMITNQLPRRKTAALRALLWLPAREEERRVGQK